MGEGIKKPKNSMGNLFYKANGLLPVKLPKAIAKTLKVGSKTSLRTLLPPPVPAATPSAEEADADMEELSMENTSLEGDSNALILPARKKSNKRKNPNQENGRRKKGKAANLIGKTSKLSKSQQRKLRKMEEEKERALMLSQSIEALEKYKIPEDRFALLQSSKSISRAETKKNIRRMTMEVEHVDQPADRSGETATSESESEPEPETAPEKIYSRQVINKKSHLQPVVVEREVEHQASVSLASHQEPLGTNELGSNDRSPSALSTGEVSKKVNEVLNKEDKKNTSPSLGDHDASKSSELKCGSHVSSITELEKDGNLQDSASQSHPSVPTVVHVLRSEEVEEKRKDLPIVMMEQEIMEAINEHSAVIICGETGCGKTTQVPQFLYEAGFGSNLSAVRSGMIGVTQPRRVAVLATGRRVAFELGVHLGKEVGFQVRHDRKIGDDCSIKFMTDGILLREVQNDFLLKRYSVIILDEAHERSVNTDILIGMLSRIIPLRQKKYEEQQQMVLSGQIISPENRIFPLKVVLMSATLRVEDFHNSPPPPRRRLFPTTTPVIEVPTRQYPVTVHFSKRTDTVDYIGQAYKKVLLIHKRLPPGGILVFVTGQREVEYLCRKLRNYSRGLMGNAAKKNEGNERTPATDSIAGINIKDINEAFDIEQNSTDMQSNRFSSYDNDAEDNDDDVPDFGDDESDVSYGSETESEVEIVGDNDGNLVDDSQQAIDLAKLKTSFEALAGKTTPELNSEGKQLPFTPKKLSKQQNGETKRDRGFSVSALRVLPLYAMLPAAAQLRVFEEVKEGERLVVVATNVAETSLTIPGIKYVVDTGREKVKNYNPSNGMEAYEVQWISKASAAQRAGRAGRTGPGHCYRLYSSAVFQNLLPDFSPAEISKVPSDSIVLVLKSMFIDKVENFPFPTPPETAALKEAERCLKTLEALDSNGRLTPLGKAMANYPLSPRHSRMLLTVIQIMRKEKCYARANLVLGYALAAAAALSLSSPFLMQFEGSHSDKDGLEQDGDVSEKKLDKQEKSRRKKLKEAAKVSRAKFSNPNSDSLTVANALQGFELSENPVEFCDENALHLKTMEEMSKLRKQLLQLVFNHKSHHELKQEFSWTHGTAGDVEQAWRFSSGGSSLSLLEEKVLCQAICAGWADRVARRIRGNLSSSEGERKVNAVRYHACMVNDTVFLHRWSSLSKSAPEFLVYSELLHTKRPYMHGATSVESGWLVKYAGSLCSFSPADESKPYYEPQTDQVFSWVIPTFGPHLWQLPLHSVPISRGADRVKAFAYALLDGHVLPCLKQVRELMAARPSKILEPEGMGERRVGNLLFKLKTRSIDSCTMLREVWEENPTELHSEIKDWFNKSCHEKFEALWSKMHVEVQMGPDKRFPRRQKREKRKTRDHSVR